MGEITLDLRLEFTIPGSKLTINGVVLGLKQATPQIMEMVLTTQAIDVLRPHDIGR